MEPKFFERNKKNQKIINGQFFDFENIWSDRAEYDVLFEPLFLDSVFEKGITRIDQKQFIEKLTYPKRIWMLSSVELRKKYIRFNNRLEAEKKGEVYLGEPLPLRQRID